MGILQPDDFKKPRPKRKEFKHVGITTSTATDQLLAQLAEACGVTPAAYLRKLVDLEGANAIINADDTIYAAKEYEDAPETIRRVYTMYPRHDQILKARAYEFDVRKSLIVAGLIQVAALEAGLDGAA